jgi:AcrR family transcriptional regulator
VVRSVDPAAHEARRRELAHAVHRTVDRVGIEGASLREIAREAGVTTGTLTHYFADRGELVEFALGLVVSESTDRVLAAAATGSLLDALCEWLPLDEHRRHEGAAWLAGISAARRDPALADGLSRRYDAAHDLLAGLFADRFRASGRTLPAAEMGLLVDEVIATVDGIATYGLADPARYTADRQRDLVQRLLARVGLEEPPAAPGPG